MVEKLLWPASVIEEGWAILLHHVADRCPKRVLVTVPGQI